MAKLKRKKKYTGRHSPAGLRYLEEQKRKGALQAGLSRKTRKELSYYSDADQEAILKAFGRKKVRRKK